MTRKRGRRRIKPAVLAAMANVEAGGSAVQAAGLLACELIKDVMMYGVRTEIEMSWPPSVVWTIADDETES